MTAVLYDTAVLHDEVVTVAPAPVLTVVRDVDTIPDTNPARRPKKVTRTPVGGGDPLVDGAARLLSIPLRHLYAALWRVGVLEVQV
ncbi:Rv1535 family protein [Mycobacterium sp. Marseille-P9652]|uniref:Rv1535 family protein n=1 Tax=Mycobacterium sp. Marseille-P9652 TaxID=2654950 RepID=UPI0012E7F73B|nr:Rv1535 family protein [Mycobacterium sp. Marseille-P9652]